MKTYSLKKKSLIPFAKEHFVKDKEISNAKNHLMLFRVSN